MVILGLRKRKRKMCSGREREVGLTWISGEKGSDRVER